MNQQLLSFQYKSESPLFQLIYKKSLESPELPIEEQVYLNHIATTFKSECLAALLLFPSTIMAYLLQKEYKKPNLNTVKFSRYTKLTLLFGLPGINVFLYSVYRRMVGQVPHQEKLEQKYMNELRPKIKIIDSSRK